MAAKKASFFNQHRPVKITATFKTHWRYHLY